MIVLGFDPGVHVGWAVLESGPNRPRFLAGGVIEAPPSVEVQVADEFDRLQKLRGIDVVAVEHVSGYAHDRPGRPARVLSARLQDCAELAGVIVGVAIGRCLKVERMPAVTWKRYLGLKTNASDAQVKIALGLLVDGLPAKSSVHMRDAVGCAYGVLRKVQYHAAIGAA
jgi:Holliday junction resolvasome RuvABC endonuclease subunit